jgi:haloalkane dehalogenase
MPSSHHLTANSLNLHYLQAGEGDPILLLHGFPTSSHLYRNILPELGKTHRAIALDLPGYGLSDKPLEIAYDYDFYAGTRDAFLDALRIGRTHLVVHDLGGPAGLYWATHHPQRVSSIVVLNTLVFPEVHWTVTAFLLALRTPGLRDFVVSPRGIVGTMKLGVVHKERMNRQTLTPYTAPFETPAARKALIKAGSGLGVAGLAKIAEKLPSLEAPLRLIYGENDRVLPDVARTMKRIQKLRPDAKLTALPGCGHFLQEDEPQRVAELIAEFLRAQSPQANAPKPDAITAADVVEAFNAWARNDLDVTFQTALDPQASLLFSFITALSD